MCIRNKGLGMFCVQIDDCVVIKGKESMTEYVFNSAVSPHVFCIVCGIHTHHKSRMSPNMLCINIACVNNFNVADYSNEVIDFDGINHPKDNYRI